MCVGTVLGDDDIVGSMSTTTTSSTVKNPPSSEWALATGYVALLGVLIVFMIILVQAFFDVGDDKKVLRELPQVYAAAKNLGPATDAKTMAVVVNAQRPQLGARTALPSSDLKTEVPYIVATSPEGFVLMEKSKSGRVYQLTSNRQTGKYKIVALPTR